MNRVPNPFERPTPATEQVADVTSEIPFCRTIITLRPGAAPFAVDRAEEVLLDFALQLKMFQRPGELVRIISTPEARHGRGLVRPAGSVMLEPVNDQALLETLDRLIRWRKESRNPQNPPREIDCPLKIADYYLSRTGSWRLPVLSGIIFAPVLREDGRILQGPGYDSDTGLYLSCDRDWPEIPTSPTREDAEHALADLLRPFSEFPFCSPADFSVHIAAILTALQRRMISAAPLFGYSAPQQRTGKSLLAESVARIATGRPAPATVTSFDPDEFRKSVTAGLHEGHLIINLDNVEVVLHSPFLSAALTQEMYSDRILGQSKKLNLSTRVLWTATGNNLTFKGDLSVRALVCRIDAQCESPEQRVFKISNLPDYIAENRKRLVVAALTLLRAYYVAGRPRQGVKPWGGFDGWSEIVREALMWAGMADPVETRAAVINDDPDREGAVALLASLKKAFADDPFTIKKAIDFAREPANQNLLDALKTVADRKGDIDSRTLGWWCRRWKDRIVDNLRLRSVGTKDGSARWKIDDTEREKDLFPSRDRDPQAGENS